MKKLTETLKREDGASLVAAILFFVLCGVGASVILASASASAGKMQQVPAADQKRFAVESAAAFLRDELTRKENIVKIKEVMVKWSNSNEIEDTLDYYYVGQEQKENRESSWVKFSDTDPSVLDDMIRYFDNPLTERDDSSAAGSKTDQETTIPVSVEKGAGTGTASVDALKTSVRLSMDSNYRITAVISDTATDAEHPEDLCQRKLTVPAQTQETIDVEVEEHQETDDEGNVTDEWTKTTITRLTTIRWERGTIEKIHPEEES